MRILYIGEATDRQEEKIIILQLGTDFFKTLFKTLLVSL